LKYPRRKRIESAILGPEWLAGAARELGKFIRNVRNYFNALTDELKADLYVFDDIKEVKDEPKKTL